MSKSQAKREILPLGENKMDIRCRKTKCKYNDRHTCKAKSILINKVDKCEKYEKKGDKPTKDTSKKMFKKVPNFAPQRDTKKMKIECKNNCVLNHEGRCVANGITINDINTKPLCMTPRA